MEGDHTIAYTYVDTPERRGRPESESKQPGVQGEAPDGAGSSSRRCAFRLGWNSGFESRPPYEKTPPWGRGKITSQLNWQNLDKCMTKKAENQAPAQGAPQVTETMVLWERWRHVGPGMLKRINGGKPGDFI